MLSLELGEEVGVVLVVSIGEKVSLEGNEDKVEGDREGTWITADDIGEEVPCIRAVCFSLGLDKDGTVELVGN